MTQAEVDDTLKRIQEHKGVQGYLIINSDGIPIRSNLDASLTQQYAALIKSLSDKARSTIREMDPSNELLFFRMRTKKHEILVAPDDEMSYVVKQPLYKRFSLDRQCPMTSSSYHGPPSFNYRPLVSSSKPFMPESPTVKQNFYITYSKPSTPVFNQ
ncbi:unnamed protein product [Rotaria magnacalcarata]|uniref:Roadblock/LAMTOR2 domain-containing protein n=4 Tax=Rotaria TaxID=231623 RepID=A0A818XMZ4_9BILA|nr:unnamed protein product [Rotaria magnacalcarata]CAF3777913.1 unnamed protein product [Rotaria magnacalcarata]